MFSSFEEFKAAVNTLVASGDAIVCQIPAADAPASAAAAAPAAAAAAPAAAATAPAAAAAVTETADAPAPAAAAATSAAAAAAAPAAAAAAPDATGSVTGGAGEVPAAAAAAAAASDAAAAAAAVAVAALLRRDNAYNAHKFRDVALADLPRLIKASEACGFYTARAAVHCTRFDPGHQDIYRVLTTPVALDGQASAMLAVMAAARHAASGVPSIEAGDTLSRVVALLVGTSHVVFADDDGPLPCAVEAVTPTPTLTFEVSRSGPDTVQLGVLAHAAAHGAAHNGAAGASGAAAASAVATQRVTVPLPDGIVPVRQWRDAMDGVWEVTTESRFCAGYFPCIFSPLFVRVRPLRAIRGTCTVAFLMYVSVNSG